MTTSIKTLAAQHINSMSEYNGDVCCVDSGAQAQDPVMINGRNGWTSTPFQNAGFSLEKLADWLYSEGGCCTYLAEIGSDGSAAIHMVDFHSDGEPFTVDEHDTLTQFCWLDQDMVYAVQSRGERFSGGSDTSIAEVVQSWLDNEFDAQDAGEWMDAEVFDADSARKLADNGFSPDQITDADGEDPLGYAFANGDVSIVTVRELIDAE